MPEKKSSRKFFKKILFLSLFFATSFLTFFTLNHLKIKKIIIVDNNKKNNSYLIGLNSIKNKLIFFIDEKTISNYLIKNNPPLDEVKVKKKLPNTIIIYPHFSSVTAQLATNNGFFLLSKKGRIINKTKRQTNQTPLINFYQRLNFYQYQAGDYLTYKEILIGLEFIERLKGLGFDSINTVDIKSYDMIVFNKKGKIEILISANKNKEELFYDLESIIKKNKINGKKLKKIDLRFNKPIITLYE